MIHPKLFKALSTFLLFFIGSFQLIAQTPCTGGMAGSYPCDNIDLLEHLSLSAMGAGAGQKGNDIWGWTHPTTGKEYALVGLTNGTMFFDISTPTTPLNIGFLPTHTGTYSTWRDIKVVNDHAYIVSEQSGHGVQIFELDRLDVTPSSPITFTEDGWINLSGPSDRAHNIVALEELNLIYPVGTTSNCSGGITTYDASNPTSPTWENCFSSEGYSHDATCFIYRGLDTEHVGKQICIGFNANDFAIIDMDNQNTLKRQTYPGGSYTHQGWVTDDQKYVLFDDELDESNNGVQTTTFVWDISDLDNPVEKHVFVNTTDAIDHNMYVKGPYVYQSNYRAGLRILDISDLDNTPPVEVAYFDIYPANDNAAFNGAWSVFPYFDSEVILINGIEQGLFVVDPNLPHNVLDIQGIGVDTVCQGNDVDFVIDNKAFSGMSASDDLVVTGLPAGATFSFSVNPVPVNTSTTLTISNTGSLATGNYSFMVEGTEVPKNRISLGFVVTSDPPGSSTLILPADQATLENIEIGFDWTASTNTLYYDLEVAYDALFQNMAYTATNLTTSNHIANIPEPGFTFFWRVISRNDCLIQGMSPVFSFRISDSAVPVELIRLEAHPLENNIALDWQTASEVSNTGFEIQRSTNPASIEFEAIDWAPSLNGNSNSIQNYNYRDSDVVAGITYYYRLKQIDIDGHYNYSPTVSASLNSKSIGVNAYPNPANDQLFLQLDAGHYYKGKATLTVHDMTGKLIVQTPISLDALADPYALDINNLSKGSYLLRISGEQVTLPIRFVKM